MMPQLVSATSTENDAPLKDSDDRRWTVKYTREWSFYFNGEWHFLDFILDSDSLTEESTRIRLEKTLRLFQSLFTAPTTFVFYNATEKNLIYGLYKYFDITFPHYFYDLYHKLMGKLVQDKNQDHPTNLYCHSKKLKTLMDYWYEGTQESIPRHMTLMSTTGRMSELDACHLVHIYKAIKDYASYQE
jgi:hypothetical protein